MKEQLINSTEKLMENIAEAMEWLDEYAPDKRYERMELIKNKLQVKNCLGIKHPRSVNAVYGESQVGKSTFISNFIGNSDNKLIVKDKSGESFDFIDRINPVGDGQEATGVVTRFTTASTADKNKIVIRLLSVKDIVLILLDSYINDFKEWAFEPVAENISSTTKILINEKYASGQFQSVLSGDDVYFIQYYLEYYYNSSKFKARVNPYFEADYWRILAKQIQNIPIHSLPNVLEVLWGYNTKLTTTFKYLIGTLEKLDFSNEVECDVSAILREEGAGLLDVARLRNIFETDFQVNVISQGKFFDLPRNILSALTTEVVLQMDELVVEDHFDPELKDRLKLRQQVIQKSDFLDFPGMRTRMELNENHELTNETLGEIILRGKVEYLFNKYDLSNDLDNFFVITVKGNVAVQSFRDKLKSWINTNIGEDAAKREAFLSQLSVPPLFIIFNKWDGVLKYNTKISKKEMDTELWSKVELALDENIYLKPNEKNRWHEAWRTSQPLFHNIYPFRSIKYSTEAFDQTDGIEEFRSEEYHKLLTNSFLSSHFTDKIFGDQKKEIWENSSVPNKDGCDNLLLRTIQASDIEVKIKKFSHLMERCRQRGLEVLSPFHESDSTEGRIEVADRKFRKVNMEMEIKLVNKEFVFGRFIEDFLISENEIYNLFNRLQQQLEDIQPSKIEKSARPYIVIRNHVQFFSKDEKNPEASDHQNLRLLKNHWGEASISEVKKRCLEENFDLELLFYGSFEEISGVKSRSTQFAEAALEEWVRTRLDINRFDNEYKEVLPEFVWGDLFDQLKEGIIKIGLQKKIDSLINPYVNKFDNDIPLGMIAHLTFGVICKYLTSAGWEFMSDEAKHKLASVSASRENSFLSKLVNRELMSEEPARNIRKKDIARLLDTVGEHDSREGKLIDEESLNVPHYDKFYEWRERLFALFIHNAEVKIPKPGNEEIGEILESIRQA